MLGAGDVETPEFNWRHPRLRDLKISGSSKASLLTASIVHGAIVPLVKAGSSTTQTLICLCEALLKALPNVASEEVILQTSLKELTVMCRCILSLPSLSAADEEARNAVNAITSSSGGPKLLLNRALEQTTTWKQHLTTWLGKQKAYTEMLPDLRRFEKAEEVTLDDLRGMKKKLALWNDALPEGAMQSF